MNPEPPNLFDNSTSFVHGLVSCLALKEMIDKIPSLSTEASQDMAWEAIASVLLSDSDNNDRTIAEA
jgi:hypothetical protein